MCNCHMWTKAAFPAFKYCDTSPSEWIVCCRIGGCKQNQRRKDRFERARLIGWSRTRKMRATWLSFGVKQYELGQCFARHQSRNTDESVYYMTCFQSFFGCRRDRCSGRHGVSWCGSCLASTMLDLYRATLWVSGSHCLASVWPIYRMHCKAEISGAEVKRGCWR